MKFDFSKLHPSMPPLEELDDEVKDVFGKPL